MIECPDQAEFTEGVMLNSSRILDLTADINESIDLPAVYITLTNCFAIEKLEVRRQIDNTDMLVAFPQVYSLDSPTNPESI